ncbi:hypothetical protein [Sporofaciens musculi]|uniref:hypothetical protein n=1 Tax=Sporofaciens musculi TaxID=2681861 RepID=UPI00216F7C35|nr:hypothetical protein [Sporofaciens musculi]MCI8890516.1 hypothetical protein [Eubacterium sp.]
MSIINTAVWSAAERQAFRYADGITKVTDPFWVNTCRGCGKVYMSCICTSRCPECGSPEADRQLGKVPYDQVVAERGKPGKQGRTE